MPDMAVKDTTGKIVSTGLAGKRRSRNADFAGLRDYPDSRPGISRKPRGRGFCYRYPNGKIIHDRNELRRIKKLAVPPAWTDVWISPYPDGRLQATGRDSRGRKQYLYHARWRESRSATKYHRMLDFAGILPALRRRVSCDMAKHGVPREKVLAVVIRLLELTLIRIGNREYFRENGSFGLTTLHDEHVDIFGSRLEFHFRGKGGKEHRVDVRDRRLARIVKQTRDIPGQELFRYVDETGRTHAVESGDVNDYLREIAGSDISAKDFRTWGGTVCVVMKFRELGDFESEQEASKNISEAVRAAASHLGNRPATCRKYYVHPLVIDAYRERTLLGVLERMLEKTPESRFGLDGYELTVRKVLQQREK